MAIYYPHGIAKSRKGETKMMVLPLSPTQINRLEYLLGKYKLETLSDLEIDELRSLILHFPSASSSMDMDQLVDIALLYVGINTIRDYKIKVGSIEYELETSKVELRKIDREIREIRCKAHKYFILSVILAIICGILAVIAFISSTQS